jgi:arginine exporter protein ArgO
MVYISIYCQYYFLKLVINRGVRMKKAEALSLSTVVVAALVLLVLIILSVIFVGRMARHSDRSRDCLQQGGLCYSVELGSSCRQHGEGLIEHPNGICQMEGPDGSMVSDPSRICCIRAG